MFRLIVEMGLLFKFALLFGVLVVLSSAGRDVFSDPTGSNECRSLNLGGVDYILHVRGSDFGWKGHTHRANIALAVHGYRGTNDEMTKMDLQLEEEVIKALLKNQTSPINENDLAMFIHALVATSKNPWNFHGLNLVGDLLKRVENDRNVHPFLVLALCNSHAVNRVHLDKIKKHLEPGDMGIPEVVANKAIALKAFACATKLPYADRLDLKTVFKGAMETAKEDLLKIQNVSGKFGNVYTTSLVVQALTAFSATGWPEGRWPKDKEDKALDYIRSQSKINVNLLQAYYIVLALNARKVNCIKDLYVGDMGLPVPAGPSYFTTYTIMDDQNPDVYFTVYMRIPEGWNFFQVMEKARNLSSNFNFSYVFDKHKKPSVYEVIGKPNDAERNLFWTICRQSNVNHDPHSSKIVTHTSSPKDILVKEKEHFTLWYRSSNCPTS